MADRATAVIEKALDEWLASKIGHLMNVLFQGLAGEDELALDRMIAGARLAVAAWTDVAKSIPDIVDGL